MLRGLVRSGQVASLRADAAVADLVDLPLEWAAHRGLAQRTLELRANVTPYAAAYVALAEVLESTLVTSDPRLSRSAGPRCPSRCSRCRTERRGHGTFSE